MKSYDFNVKFGFLRKADVRNINGRELDITYKFETFIWLL